MEYIIMKSYEEDKKEDPVIKEGFERFNDKEKKYLIVFFALLIFSFICCVQSINAEYYNLWIGISLVSVMCSVVALNIIDNKHIKANINNNANMECRKIEILDQILVEKFSINDINKINQLIEKYNRYIQRKEERKRKINKIIATLFSAFVGILTILLSDMDGLTLTTWLYLGAFFLSLIVMMIVVLYCIHLHDTLSEKYRYMVEDLETLKIIKY